MANDFTYIVDHRKAVTLPYNPEDSGWKSDGDIKCCIVFLKDDYRLRINKHAQMVILEKGEEHERVAESFIPFADKTQFDAFISDNID